MRKSVATLALALVAVLFAGLTPAWAQSPPGPPTAGTLTLQADTTRATFSWSPPATGGAPTGYDVYRKDAAGVYRRQDVTGPVAGTARTWQFSGLTPGSTVDAVAVAFNAAGRSAFGGFTTLTRSSASSGLLAGLAARDSASFAAIERVTGTQHAHRTYFRAADWGQWARIVGGMQADLAAGRVDVASFKPPCAANGDCSYAAGWASVASGQQDAQLDALGSALAGLSAPVYLTFHHEPDNDGVASAWLAAYNRFYDRVKARAGVKAQIGPILIGCTVDGTCGRSVAEWTPSLARSDYLGDDPYNWYLPGRNSYPSPAAVLGPAVAWGQANHKPVLIGETGAYFSYAYPRTLPNGQVADPARWVADLGAYALSQPQITVLCYWNNYVTTAPEFVMDAAGAAAWRTFIQDPRSSVERLTVG